MNVTEKQLLAEIFKTEYSNLVAVLCHYYGVTDIQVAEDIVSETFLKAMKVWSHSGIPHTPKAWLRKVAQNKLLDHFRREKAYQDKILPQLYSGASGDEPIEISNEIIEDSQLRMIFVICNPQLKIESQICLALRILCGLNIEEIATGLLSNKETINKRLYRAKKAIRDNSLLDRVLSEYDYRARLDNVLRVIYLLFNEGYYSSVKEENIREDICWEAMRLTVFLARQKLFSKEKVHALLALMCFHSSRLDARKDGENGDVLYYDQDRSRWNQQLIQKGKNYLQMAVRSNYTSKYHLEASIAYWHTLEGDEKWDNILGLYDKLLSIENSSAIALNRIYALGMAKSADKAIDELKGGDFDENHYYFCLMAELHRIKKDEVGEFEFLQEALKCAHKKAEKKLIEKKLARLAR